MTMAVEHYVTDPDQETFFFSRIFAITAWRTCLYTEVVRLDELGKDDQHHTWAGSQFPFTLLCKSRFFILVWGLVKCSVLGMSLTLMYHGISLS